MQDMNGFIDENIPAMDKLFEELAVLSRFLSPSLPSLSVIDIDQCCFVLNILDLS